MKIKNMYGLLTGVLLAVNTFLFYIQRTTIGLINVLDIAVIVFLVLIAIFYKFNKVSLYLMVALLIFRTVFEVRSLVYYFGENEITTITLLELTLIARLSVATVGYLFLCIIGFSKLYDKRIIESKLPIAVTALLAIISIILETILVWFEPRIAFAVLLVPVYMAIVTMYIENKQFR